MRPLFEDRPNLVGEFEERDLVRGAGPSSSSGFPSKAVLKPSALQQREHFVSPQELDDREGIRHRIPGRETIIAEANRGIRLDRFNDPPPLGDSIAYAFKVPCVRHDRHLVKHLRIQSLLLVQPCERVFLTFDLEAVKTSVHDCKINTDLTLAYAELVEKASLRQLIALWQLLGVQLGEPPPQRISNVSVAHRRHCTGSDHSVPDPHDCKQAR
jgi:hypothetical protein